MNNQEFKKCYAWTKLHKITLKLARFVCWIRREYDYFTVCYSGPKMILHHGCLTRPLVVFPATGSRRVTENFKIISPGSTCGLTWCLAILTMQPSGQVVWSEHQFFLWTGDTLADCRPLCLLVRRTGKQLMLRQNAQSSGFYLSLVGHWGYGKINS